MIDIARSVKCLLAKKVEMGMVSDGKVASLEVCTRKLEEQVKTHVGKEWLTIWQTMKGMPVVIKFIYHPQGNTASFTERSKIDPAIGLDFEQLNQWRSCTNQCKIHSLLVKRYLETLLNKSHCLRSKTLGDCRVIGVDYVAVQAKFGMNPILLSQSKQCESMTLYDPAQKSGNHVILKLIVEASTGRKTMFVDPSYLQVDPWSETPVKFFVDFPLDKYCAMFSFEGHNPFVSMQGKLKMVLDMLIDVEGWHPNIRPLLCKHQIDVYRLIVTELVKLEKAAISTT